MQPEAGIGGFGYENDRSRKFRFRMQGGALRRPDPHPCGTWKPGAQRRGLPVTRAGGWLSRQVRQDLHWSRRSLRKAGEAGGFSCRDRQQMLCTIKASDLQQVQRIRCCTARSISTQTPWKFRSTSRLENRRTEIPSRSRSSDRNRSRVISSSA